MPAGLRCLPLGPDPSFTLLALPDMETRFYMSGVALRPG
jgi:hypothetical protein